MNSELLHVWSGTRSSRVCRATLRAAAAALISLSVQAAQGGPTEIVRIRAGGYVASNGELRKGAAIDITDGAISRVAAGDAARSDDEAPKAVATLDYEAAVVSPGLIDVHSALGAFDQLRETKTAIRDTAFARDAFNAYHEQIRAAREAGVTCFGLSPGDENLVGGAIAVCKSGGREGTPYVLEANGPLKISLSPRMMIPDREPTSRAMALEMLRKTVEEHRSAKSESPTRAFASGARAALADAPSGGDVLSLLRVGAPRGLKFAFIHERDARSVAAEIAAAKSHVVVGPYDWSETPRDATAGAVFEKAGVGVAISGGLPNAPADSLRISAAIAARNGLSVNAARRAITRVPAEILGIGDRVGTIEQGRAADLVIFSGDPLDLRSRVIAVYIDGVRVWGDPPDAEERR